MTRPRCSAPPSALRDQVTLRMACRSFYYEYTSRCLTSRAEAQQLGSMSHRKCKQKDMPANFTCDLSETASPLKHALEHTVGASGALLALDASRHQSEYCATEWGLRDDRFNGLLDDDVGNAHQHQDKSLYLFFNTTRICKFMLSIEMRTFVELSFVPVTFATDSDVVFHFRGNVTPQGLPSFGGLYSWFTAPTSHEKVV